jgi:DNA-binding MarR family transcriptional regulator
VACAASVGGIAGEVWRLLLELVASHRPVLPQAAAELRLSPGQARVLTLLDPRTPLPMRALAEALRCRTSNVTALVDRLEASGYVERRPAQDDRRVKLLVVTHEGEQVRERLLARLHEPPHPISALTADDQRTLHEILRRALAASRSDGRRTGRSRAARTRRLA